MHATPQIITTAIQLYFIGESFRNVQKFLKLQGVKMSHVAVYKWIRKYVSLMQGYLEKIQPQVGDAWRTDELFVKIKGDMKYFYAIMDDFMEASLKKRQCDIAMTQSSYNLNFLLLQVMSQHLAIAQGST
jgi:transposase-like protein